MSSPLSIKPGGGRNAYARTHYAVEAVSCPKCHARPGWPCHSTGGGNHAFVADHAARSDRIADWTVDQRATASALVDADYRARREGRPIPDDHYTAAEAAARPIPEPKPKPVTPKGVRLSERQAEEIEWAAERGGTMWAPTTHLHGEAAHRQTVQALEAKGVVEYVGASDHGRQRNYRLTDFGWQVYRQHRLIIRRLPEGNPS